MQRGMRGSSSSYHCVTSPYHFPLSDLARSAVYQCVTSVSPDHRPITLPARPSQQKHMNRKQPNHMSLCMVFKAEHMLGFFEDQSNFCPGQKRHISIRKDFRSGVQKFRLCRDPGQVYQCVTTRWIRSGNYTSGNVVPPHPPCQTA